MIKPSNARLNWTASMIYVAVMVGCGGHNNVASVSGKVTLDGQPLDAAVVQFQPVAGNTPSTGVTNSAGEYTLRYTRDTEGAEIGDHIVSIATHDKGNPDAEPPRPPTKEKVPAKYNKKSELKKSVESGSNTIDFALESGEQVGTHKE